MRRGAPRPRHRVVPARRQRRGRSLPRVRLCRVPPRARQGSGPGRVHGDRAVRHPPRQPRRRRRVAWVARPRDAAGRRVRARAGGGLGPAAARARQRRPRGLGELGTRGARGGPVGRRRRPRAVRHQPGRRRARAAGPGREGLGLLDEAAARALGCEGARLDTVVFTVCTAIAWCCRIAEFERARRWIRAGDELSARYGSPHLFTVCRVHHGGILFTTGDWAEAESELEAAVAASRSGERALHAEALTRLAELRLAQGRLDEAARLIAGSRTRRSPSPCWGGPRLAGGQLAAASAILRRRLRALGDRCLECAPLLELLCEVETAQGALGAALSRGPDARRARRDARLPDHRRPRCPRARPGAAPRTATARRPSRRWSGRATASPASACRSRPPAPVCCWRARCARPSRSGPPTRPGPPSRASRPPAPPATPQAAASLLRAPSAFASRAPARGPRRCSAGASSRCSSPRRRARRRRDRRAPRARPQGGRAPRRQRALEAGAPRPRRRRPRRADAVGRGLERDAPHRPPRATGRGAFARSGGGGAHRSPPVSRLRPDCPGDEVAAGHRQRQREHQHQRQRRRHPGWHGVRAIARGVIASGRAAPLRGAVKTRHPAALEARPPRPRAAGRARLDSGLGAPGDAA